LRLDYTNPALLSASIQGRYVGDQFEDDLNTLKLGDFFVVDLMLSRALKTGWEAFLRVENLFDRTYEVAKSADGIVSIGAPLLVHGGIRARF
jgi:iron complex outermembrane receptor protein